MVLGLMLLADETSRRGAAYAAFLALGFGLTFLFSLLLVLTLVRRARRLRAKRRPRESSVAMIDPWVESGRRLKLPDEDEP